MINIFKKIKKNNRYVLDNRTIIIDDINHKTIKYYDLNEWWERQPITPKYYYINLYKFIFKGKSRN